MRPGAYISGIGHAGLIGWLFFGPGFSSDPLPFESAEVSVISGEDFASLVAGQQPEEPTTITPDLQPPEVEDAPEPAESDIAPKPTPAPEPVEPPAEESPPDVTQIEPLPPQTDATDEAPVEPVQPALDTSETIVAGANVRPSPRPTTRVAPTPVAQPEPDVAVDEVVQQAAEPDQAAETPVEDALEETAPEAAATEIVTEAEVLDTTEDVQVSAAPTTSVRPSVRPNRRAAKPETAPEETSSSVENALAEALSGETTPTKPTGPPLTGGEKDALRVAVSQCWNVGSLSSAALETTVVIGIQMTEDAKPVTSSIRLVSFDGGSESAAKQAYEAGRRAIIRCAKNGYNLPSEKFEQWRDIEMTFNPAKMRLK